MSMARCSAPCCRPWESTFRCVRRASRWRASVPPLNQVMEQLAMRYFNCAPLIVGPGIKTGMPILYENPKEVGADRIVNAVAAYDHFDSACIVVDFGTATTLDYVTGRGEYAGGAIAPGLGVSMDALVEHAAKLYQVELVRPQAKPSAGPPSRHPVGTDLRLYLAGRWTGRPDPQGARREHSRDRDRRPRGSDRAGVETYRRGRRVSDAEGIAPDLRAQSSLTFALKFGYDRARAFAGEPDGKAAGRIVTDSMIGMKLPDFARHSDRVATVLGHNPSPFTGPGHQHLADRHRRSSDSARYRAGRSDLDRSARQRAQGS